MALRENELTDSQRRVMVFLVAYIREHGWAPTQRELMIGMGWTGPYAVSTTLKVLERKRWIRLGVDHAARQIRILRIPR